MIVSCESCGSNFSTESDPHVVKPTRQGNKLYCYCHIKGFNEFKIVQLEKKIVEALGRYDSSEAMKYVGEIKELATSSQYDSFLKRYDRIFWKRCYERDQAHQS